MRMIYHVMSQALSYRIQYSHVIIIPPRDIGDVDAISETKLQPSDSPARSIRFLIHLARPETGKVRGSTGPADFGLAMSNSISLVECW